MHTHIYPIYKPVGPTSHDILKRIRAGVGIKKVGHGGTLDPLASGVLIVAVGREATKQLGAWVRQEKEYVAKVILGKTSTTDDEEGEKTDWIGARFPTKEMISNTLKEFTGTTLQVPPIYSAIKVKGETAYKLARKGIPVVLKPRKVYIREIELMSYAWPELVLRCVTGSGVYIRSLARDIGKCLDVGGYLGSLERTRVGTYRKKDALSVEDFIKKILHEKEIRKK